MVAIDKVVDEGGNRYVRHYGNRVPIHDPGDRNTLKRRSGDHFPIACRGSAAQEHADKKAPHPPDEITGHHAKHAEDDQHSSEDISCAGGDPCRPGEIAAPHPERGAQHTPTIEREGRNEVEKSQHAVDVSEIPQRALDRLRSVPCRGKCHKNEENASEQEARRGPGRGHEEFALGARGLTIHFGYAPEDEERNTTDRNFVPPGDERMCRFVEDDGAE